MTATAQPQTQPPQQNDVPSDEQLAAASAAALAVAVTPAAATAILAKLYIRAHIQRPVLQAALQIIMSMPSEADGIAGPATAQMARLNLIRRAQMLISISRRLAGDVRDARSQGTSMAGALLDGAERERRYFGMHREAIWNRNRAAMAVDMAALEHGLLLGWKAHRDDRVTPDCLAADGKNFRADAMPKIGYPGAVHLRCRCWPVAPYPGAPLLPSSILTPGRSAHLQRRMQRRMAG